MALILTEEQMMVRDNARAFLADKAPVAHLRKLRDTRDADGFSRSLWKAFAEMGFCGLLLPENLGGSGLGYVEAGVIMEEIGRNLTPSPFLSRRESNIRIFSRIGESVVPVFLKKTVHSTVGKSWYSTPTKRASRPVLGS